MISRFSIITASLILVCAMADSSNAQRVQQSAPTAGQYENAVRSQDLPRYDVEATVNRTLRSGLFGRSPRTISDPSVGSAPIQKPFENVSNRPAVSPYLNLMREGFDDDTLNYQSLVRPQLNQIETNQRQQQANQQIYRQLQALEGRASYPVSGSTAIAPTGHPTVYLNHSHYYRMPARR